VCLPIPSVVPVMSASFLVFFSLELEDDDDDAADVAVR